MLRVARALLVRQGPQLDASDLTFEEPLPRPPEPGAPLELPEGVTLDPTSGPGVLQRQTQESGRCSARRVWFKHLCAVHH
jgi:hypothetical protein